MKYVTQPGRYRAYVERPTTGGWLSQTDNGAEFVRIPLVIDHEDPTQGGCQITWNGFLNTDKVIDRTTRMLMEALKVPVNWFELLASGDGSFLEGRPVLITVEQATKANDHGGRTPRVTKSGDPIFEVAWLNDPDKVREVQLLDNSKISNLARKMRAISQAIKSETPGAPAPRAAAPAPARQRPQGTVYATDPVEPHYNAQSPVSRRQPVEENLEDDDIPF
jgi:hypothetical protein